MLNLLSFKMHSLFCIGRKESALIHEIIQWVELRIVDYTNLRVLKDPFGVESHLSIGRKDIIHMVGMFEIGGNGKLSNTLLTLV